MSAAPRRSGQVTPDHERQKKQAIVPERADIAFVRRGADNPRAVFDFEAQGARPDLQQAIAESDQPPRAPAFDLQGVEGPAPLSCQR